jgi:hypothetical protein
MEILSMNTISSRQSLDSGLALVLILLLLSLFIDQLYVKPAILVLLICMIYPDVFKPFAYIWFKLSAVLGHVASKVLLSIVFFVIVLPIGLIRRLFGSDAMKLKAWQSGDQSVFIVRNHLFSTEDIKYPY